MRIHSTLRLVRLSICAGSGADRQNRADAAMNGDDGLFHGFLLARVLRISRLVLAMILRKMDFFCKWQIDRAGLFGYKGVKVET